MLYVIHWLIGFCFWWSSWSGYGTVPIHNDSDCNNLMHSLSYIGMRSTREYHNRITIEILGTPWWLIKWWFTGIRGQAIYRGSPMQLVVLVVSPVFYSSSRVSSTSLAQLTARIPVQGPGTGAAEDATDHLWGGSYRDHLKAADLPTLHDRRLSLCEAFYKKRNKPDSRLCHLFNTNTDRVQIPLETPKAPAWDSRSHKTFQI